MTTHKGYTSCEAIAFHWNAYCFFNKPGVTAFGTGLCRPSYYWKFSIVLEYFKRKICWNVSSSQYKNLKTLQSEYLSYSLMKQCIISLFSHSSGLLPSLVSQAFCLLKFSSKTTFSTNSSHILLSLLKSVLSFKCPSYFTCISLKANLVFIMITWLHVLFSLLDSKSS